MAQVIYTFYPNNPFILQLKLEAVDPATFETSPYTGPAGSVTVFIATSNLNTAVAADGTLSTLPIHKGDGKWGVYFTPNVMTFALLNGLFAATTPYLISLRANGFREYTELAYLPVKPSNAA